jgi:predicted nuclease of predicted toxin-antitoxin system
MGEAITFYTDGHIPLAVVRQARHKASAIAMTRCEEIGMKDARDEEHWEYVLTHQHMLITADRGFLALAAELNRQGKSHPGIIYVTPHMQGEACIGPLVELTVFLHEAIEAGAATLDRDIHNRVEYIR